MSYARLDFSSSVNVFLDCNGYFVCELCQFSRQAIGEVGDFHAASTDEIVEHLEAHVEAGGLVPRGAFERLREDQEENDVWLRDLWRKRTA